MATAACDAPRIASNPSAVFAGTPYDDPAIVYIEVSRNSSVHHACSGAFIGPRIILTVAHCVAGLGSGTWSAVAYDGGDINTNKGKSYQIDWSRNRVATGANWEFGDPPPDFALLETTQSFEGRPVLVATDLPTPTNIASFRGQPVDLVGYGESVYNGGTGVRRLGKMTMTGEHRIWEQNGVSYQQYTLRPSSGQTGCAGDSGGPALLNGALIGVYSTGPAQGFCSPQWVAGIGYVVPRIISSVDPDRDGVGATDNCPTVANPDQANCDAQNELANPGGDACDPDPCIYMGGVTPQNIWADEIGPFVVHHSWNTRAFYRGVGFTPGSDYKYENVDAYYCACHDPDSPDPHHPIWYDQWYCENTICAPTRSPAQANTARDTGFLRLNWVDVYNDSLDPPFVNPQSCPLGNNDSDGANNDCLSPIPSRLFRKPYSGAPQLAKTALGWEAYWTSSDRTRSFDWDWRKQDYPHRQGEPYFPPIDAARVRLYAKPVSVAHDMLHIIDNNYTPVGDNLVYAIKYISPWKVTLWETETSILPDPPYAKRKFGQLAGDPPAELLLRPIDVWRQDPDLLPYLWGAIPMGSAISGLPVGRVNPENGELQDFVPSQAAFGDPVFTTAFAAARWAQNDAIFVFGGESAFGTMASRLWYGVPDYDSQGNPIYSWWEETGFDTPMGRASAVLVADVPRNRLVLLGGRTESGAVLDGFAYDVSSRTWSSLDTSESGLQPFESAGHAHADQMLYLYGGRSGDTYYEGLTEVNLSIMRGRRIDGSGGPGPRAGSALRYVPESSAVYLFGGKAPGGVTKNDLWRFSLISRTWQQLAAQGAVGAPPGMWDGSLAVGSRDGSVTVVTGRRAESVGQPLWKFRGAAWKSFDQLMRGGQ